MNHSVAETMVLCVGLPLKDVAELARSVSRGTVVMAAHDLETAWQLLGSADGTPAATPPAEAPPAEAPPAEVARPTTPRGTIQVGRLTIDPPVREVVAGDRPVRLSAREFDLLTLLASDLHRVWSFAALVKALWDTDYLGDHEQLASTVKRLRKRLGSDAGCEVHSVHGVGYRLVASEAKVA